MNIDRQRANLIEAVLEWAKVKKDLLATPSDQRTADTLLLDACKKYVEAQKEEMHQLIARIKAQGEGLKAMLKGYKNAMENKDV